MRRLTVNAYKKSTSTDSILIALEFFHPGMTKKPLNPHRLGVIELENFKCDEYIYDRRREGRFVKNKR